MQRPQALTGLATTGIVLGSLGACCKLYGAVSQMAMGAVLQRLGPGLAGGGASTVSDLMMRFGLWMALISLVSLFMNFALLAGSSMVLSMRPRARIVAIASCVASGLWESLELLLNAWLAYAMTDAAVGSLGLSAPAGAATGNLLNVGLSSAVGAAWLLVKLVYYGVFVGYLIRPDVVALFGNPHARTAGGRG